MAARGPLIGAVAGLLFWWATASASAVREPWDAPGFGYIYLLAMVLCALIGALYPRRAALSGALFVLAQMPIMLATTGIGSMIVPGLVVLAIMALPGAAAGALGARAGARMSDDR